MKMRIIPALLFLALLSGAAQAYIVTFDAPAENLAGAPIEVTGSTTFPAGTQFDLILYKTTIFLSRNYRHEDDYC